MKKSLVLCVICLINIIPCEAQDLLPQGHVYQNDTTNVFIFTPAQAQQVIYWKQDSDTLKHVSYQLQLCDSLNTLYEHRIDILETEIDGLYEEIDNRGGFFNTQNIRRTGTGVLIGIIIGVVFFN